MMWSMPRPMISDKENDKMDQPGTFDRGLYKRGPDNLILSATQTVPSIHV